MHAHLSIMSTEVTFRHLSPSQTTEELEFCYMFCYVLLCFVMFRYVLLRFHEKQKLLSRKINECFKIIKQISWLLNMDIGSIKN